MSVSEKFANLERGKFWLFAGIGILTALFAALAVSRLVYPFDNGILEAYNWLPAELLAAGKNPYAYAFEPPYNMSPYGVVFYALMAAGLKLFGFQLWFGRLISIVAFGVCVLAIAGIARAVTKTKQAILVSILAALAMYPAQYWIGAMRPDLIAAAFAFSALYLCFSVRNDEPTSPLRFAGIVALAALAFFTKQTFLFFTGIVFLRLWQLGKRREAFLFAAILFALVAGGTFLLNETSGGGYAWQHFTHARRLPFSFARSVLILRTMLEMSVFFFFGTFLLIFLFFKRRSAFLDRDSLFEYLRSPKTLLLFYFAAAAAWAFVSSGRVGSNVNYYFESAFAAAIIAGFVYEDFAARRAARKFALAFAALLVIGGAFQFARLLRGEYYRWQALSFYRETFQTAAQYIPPGGECVSVALELAMWNGCRPNFGDFEEYAIGWSPELHEIFEQRIRETRYAAVFWNADDFAAKFPNYRLVEMSQAQPSRYYRIYLYVPARQVEPSK